MDRELLLAVIAVAAAGPWLVVAGRRRDTSPAAASGRDLERARWRALWRPFAPLLVLAAGLLGWAVQEPSDAEMPSRWLALLAVPGGLLALRAVVRAVRSLTIRPSASATGTVGLLRPTVRIAPILASRLDAAALAAVVAHEAAHVRHRDPLRIWLARLATDLQPGPGAADRLRAWLTALELARDEEARETGAAGTALAEAVLSAARLPRVGASVAGPAEDLTARIDRLLAPIPPRVDDPATRWWIGLLPVAIAAGLLGGEPLLRLVLQCP